MKLVNIILLAFLFSSNVLLAETKEVNVTTGGNENTVWYSLKESVVKEVPKNNWDIAFQTGQNGSILLNCQKGFKLYEIVDSDEFTWDETIDTTGLATSDKFKNWINSEETWNTGAFNLGKDGFVADGDFGWGDYDMSDHGIKGKKVFVLIFPDGTAKKMSIYKLLNRKYEFKYANLDGTEETYASVNKNARENVSFIYFDLATNDILPEVREPNNTSWDLVFGSYMVNYQIPGTDYYQAYPVGGIKQNQNVFAVQMDEIDVDNVTPPNEDQYDANITTIGSDWKKFSMEGGYTIVENRAYFVKSFNEEIYKLVFTGYSGSSEGKYTFNQTRIGTSVNETMGKVALAVYPNVIESNQELTIVISNNMPEQYNLSIHDMTGKTLLNDVIESDYLKKHNINGLNLAPGVYFIHLTNQKGVLTQKFIVR